MTKQENPLAPTIGALATAIVCFCSHIGKHTDNVHTVNLDGKKRLKQIRSNKNKHLVFLTSKDHELVNVIARMAKQGLRKRTPEEMISTVVDEVQFHFPGEIEQLSMLKKLAKVMKSTFPAPWTVGADEPCLIDANGKIIFSLPVEEKLALQHCHLEGLVAFGSPTPSSFSGKKSVVLY